MCCYAALLLGNGYVYYVLEKKLIRLLICITLLNQIKKYSLVQPCVGLLDKKKYPVTILKMARLDGYLS